MLDKVLRGLRIQKQVNWLVIITVSFLVWFVPFTYKLWYKYEILEVVRSGSPLLEQRVAALEHMYNNTIILIQEDSLIIGVYQTTLFEVVEGLASGEILPADLSILTRSIIYNLCNISTLNPPNLNNNTVRNRYLGCVEVIKYEERQ